MAIGFFPPDINTESAVAVQPTAQAVISPGFFTIGNATTVATQVTDRFLNGLLAEFSTLAQAGGVPLSASSPSMTANILALINAGAFVRRAGDTMTGNLTLGTAYGANAPNSALVVQNGSTMLNIVPAATAAAYNPVTQAGDTLLWYTTGTANTGALTIAPSGTGATGGLRIDNTGQVTVNRPFTASGGLTTNSISSSTASIAALAVSGLASFNGTASFAGQSSFAASPLLANNVFIAAKDAGGTSHSLIGIGSDNYARVVSGSAGFALTNAAGSTNTLLADNSGNVTVAGSLAAPNLRLRASDGLGTALIYTDQTGLNDLVIQTGSAGGGYRYASFDASGNFGVSGQISGGVGSFSSVVTCAPGGGGNQAVVFSQFPFSAGGNGWTKLPNGLILQWGTGTIYAPNECYFALPTSFPSVFLSIVGGEVAAETWASGNGPTMYGFSRTNNSTFGCFCSRLITTGIVNYFAQTQYFCNPTYPTGNTFAFYAVGY